ncbi:MAG: replicative DNA helicase [Oscillospiraceae bacterium]|jgi:replicative DNA helicase|nr:replicative DNA helicase [Oscillospiraceae bacterium]
MPTALKPDFINIRDNADGSYSDGVNLPYSLEAEQAVLGSVLLDPNCINDIADMLRVEHFYMPEHQAIYRVMSVKMMESRVIDFVTVLEALKSEGVFSGDEGKAYLLKLAQLVPTVTNVSNYARIVREKHDVRMLINAAREIMDDAMDSSIEPSMLLDSAEQKIYEIRRDRQTGGLIPIHEVLASNYEIFNKLASDERDQFVGIPTGISSLDEITTGLNRSDLIIVGARPGMGKTSFALNLARNVAVKQNRTVAFFTLEMSREQLVNRLLSSEAKVSSKKLRVGNLTPEEWTRIATASGVLCKAPMYFDDTSSITVPEMKARLRRLKNVDFVVIDYLQLMHSPRRTENRVQEVSEITRSLKIMAKELNIPLLVCAQLARSTERQANHRPGLADLRESGSIEQDADQVLFLYRDEYYINEKSDPSEVEVGTSEVIVAKNRHGELGTVKLSWIGEFTQFTSLEMHRSG